MDVRICIKSTFGTDDVQANLCPRRVSGQVTRFHVSLTEQTR